MDVIVKSVLHFVQGLEGLDKTIIAGGAVRDNILGLTPNDYDFCIPSVNKTDMTMLAGQVANEFKIPSSAMISKTKDYTHKSNNGQSLTSVWSFTFEGRKIDLIGHREAPDETFANKVIEKFDYGINMVYYDGNQVIMDNHNFGYDLDCSVMSLINLDSISNLPNAMQRYNNLDARLREAGLNTLSFRAPVLTLNRPREEKLSKKKYSGDFSNTIIGQITPGQVFEWPTPVTTNVITPEQVGNAVVGQGNPANEIALDNNF